MRYFWYNFRLYFLEPWRWSFTYPFIRDIAIPVQPGHGVESHYGVLSNFPVVWLALAVPLAWRGRTAETRSTLRRFVAAAVLLFGICALTLCLFFNVTIRYEMEFLPTLGLLAVIGIFSLERALANRRVWRNAIRWGWGVLLAVSVAFNLFASYDRHADFHENYGSALFARGQVDKGIAQIEKALEIKPNDGEANNSLGYALLQKGRVDEAIPHFQKTLEIQPDNFLAQQNLGYALLQKGRVDEAITHYNKALEIQPNNAEEHNMQGYIYMQIGRMDEAIAHFKRAVELRPNMGAYHYNLGYALSQKGRIRETIACFQKALELDPNNQTILNNLAWLLAACPDASLRKRT